MEMKAVLEITVTPKSSRSEILIDSSGNIKVFLNAPPADGKANAECIALLSKKLKTAKSNINIEKGDHARKKRISVSGISKEQVIALLRNNV